MDPIQMRELRERQFWAGVTEDARAVAEMAAGDAPVPPEVRDRIDRKYRIVFTCKSCPDEHTITGTFRGMVQAVMVLTARGIDEILVQEEAYAATEDAETADETLEQRGLDPNINAMLDDKFFTRKP